MFSKSIKRMSQSVKTSRFRYAAIFALLVLVLVFGAVSANGHGRPHPPRPPEGPMWGKPMPMPNWRPWMPAQPVPTITIIAVVKDSSVTFETANFPPEQDFTVTMGRMYTRGIGGIEVGTFSSGDGSPTQQTFSIPEELFGHYRISIRAQTAHRYPYYAYNWFYNNTATVESSTAAEAETAETTVEEAPAEAEAAPATPEAGTGGAEEAEVPAGDELTGFVWQWTEFSDPVQGTVTVESPEQYTIEFLPEGLVGIKADCNNGSGSYIVDEGGSIDIAIGAMTLALCAPESLSDQFVQYLNDVAVSSFDEGDLLLDLMADAGTMRFTAEAAASTEEEVEEPAATASVTGTVTYLQRIALPDDAVVTVQVQDISLADAPAVVLGEQVIETAGQQVPIAYEVTYDPTAINENLTYAVSARIEDAAGTLLFINDTVIPVITNDNPTEDVEIMTVPVSSGDEAEGEGDAAAPEEGTLTGVVWQWTEFSDPVQGSLPIDAPEKYTVEFGEDGVVAILADCNSGSGSYVAEEGSIDITVGAVTLALCEESSLSDQFLQYLDAATTYFFDEGDLLMDLPVDSGTLRFSAAADESAAASFVASAKTAVTTVVAAVNGNGHAYGMESMIPTIKICSVVKDESVTFVTDNFPADQEFAVKMGITLVHYPPMDKYPMPTKPMPNQAPMGPGMGPGMGPEMGKPGMGPEMGKPGMGPKPMNSDGMWAKPMPETYTAYYEAGTLESGEGGVITATFDIPEELAGSYRINILLRTAHQYPYLSYNWFYNNTADVCNGIDNNDA